MAGNASRDIVLKSIPNRNMLTMGKSPAVNFAFPIQMYSIQMYLAPRVAIVMAKERVLGWEKGSAWTMARGLARQNRPPSALPAMPGPSSWVVQKPNPTLLPL